MNYLQLTEQDLDQHPNLEQLIWPQGAAVRSTHAAYYVPEDHPNIALIACCSQRWVTIPINSNRMARTLI